MVFNPSISQPYISSIHFVFDKLISAVNIKYTQKQESFSSSEFIRIIPRKKIERLTQLIDKIDTNRLFFDISNYRNKYRVILILADILEQYWDDFSVDCKIKILKSAYPIYNSSISSRTDSNIRRNNKKSELSTSIILCRVIFEDVFVKSVFKKHVRLTFASCLELRKVIQKIYRKDGHLISDIEEFKLVNKLSKKTIEVISPQDYHIPQRTSEQTSQGVRKLEEFMKYKRELWENMSEEERKTSDAQFEMLNQHLEESRS